MAEIKCQGCKIKENYRYWYELPPTKHQFCQVMHFDFKQRLQIPKKFADCFKEKLAPWCTLIGASQNKWRVKLSRSTDEEPSLAFLDGWQQFVTDNGVELNDFLVFRYVGNSSFEVFVFDKSCCEREGTHFAKNTLSSSSQITTCNSILHRCNSASNSNNSEVSVVELKPDEVDKDGDTSWESDDDDDDDDDDDNDDDDVVMEVKRVKRCTRKDSSNQGKFPQIQKYFVSNRRKLTEAEKQRPSKMAKQFMREIESVPVFSITLRPSHVYHGFHLTIPKTWAMKHMLKGSHEVELLVPKARAGKSWIVGCAWTPGSMRQCQLRAKWPMFVLDNDLEEHDACVFELIQDGAKSTTPVFNVHIFRAVDRIVPLSVSTRMV